MKPFTAPRETLGSLGPETAAALIAAASDIAIVLDHEGIVRDVAFHDETLYSNLQNVESWPGRPLVDVVTSESRAKVEALLREVDSLDRARSRHINHPSSQRNDVAVAYTAARIGSEGRIMALGRDLRAISELQFRLVEAQQSMERDYSRLRNMEMRYRLLFQESAEPVLIVDAATGKLVEANPAAGALFGEQTARIIGRPFLDILDPDSRKPADAFFTGIRVAGRADDMHANLSDGRGGALVSASLFRQGATALFLVRLSRLDSQTPAAVLPKMTWKLLKLIENAPDAFVVTDPDGLILSANGAFLEMAELASEQQARTESLGRWLGRAGADLSVLVTMLRQNGLVRLFAATIRGDFGTVSDVEISAVSVMNSERQCLGFAIRNVSRRLKADPLPGRGSLPTSVAHLTELVGRVSLKELVREATDVIERLSIEAALELTRDNRASAADMLGLSRQSLYVKLRRYGMIDPTADTDGSEG